MTEKSLHTLICRTANQYRVDEQSLIAIKWRHENNLCYTKCMRTTMLKITKSIIDIYLHQLEYVALYIIYIWGGCLLRHLRFLLTSTFKKKLYLNWKYTLLIKYLYLEQTSLSHQKCPLKCLFLLFFFWNHSI